MKLLSTLILLVFTFFASAQSTALRVYEIFQEKCVACHDHESPQSGLDLEGSGASHEERMQQVYNNIVGVSPQNNFAADKGYQYIFPGRADKSFIFRKINNALEPTITLEGGEMQNMPPYGSPDLTDIEKEMIRQWIAYGAPQSAEVVSEALISDFYNNSGERSFPDGPPPAPAPSEGFQIKMGPFYLEPGGEVEYFQKYQLDLPEDVDVDRMEIQISNYSHHFIIYDYESPSDAANVPPGYQLDIDHNPGVGITTSVAEPTDLRLPAGTAFIWEKDIVLNLNAHYINYSAFNPYQAEAYVNVYTKPAGTAAQEMQATLIPNINIYIPNNGNEHTETAHVTFPGEVWVWILGGHTHRYGTGYKIWRRTPQGEKGELLYDGACPQGEPDCVSPFFDYQHIAPRTFDPLIHVDLNDGLIHEATWINDGPGPVWWGPTSQDEMMLFGMYYVTDTTGLSNPTSTFEEEQALADVYVFPNPTAGTFDLNLPPGINSVNFQLFDTQGKNVYQKINIRRTESFNLQSLPKGMYLYRIVDPISGNYRAGKIIFE
jgi:hypothetical protein